MNPVRDDNFSQAELDKFNELAHRWWDPEGPQKALHALNPARLGYVASRTTLRGARILDLGCGIGHSCHLLAPRETVGVDLDAAALEGQERETVVADMRALRTLPPGLVFTAIDLTPEVIATTGHRAIAGGYHRGAAAMDMVMTGFTAAPDAARASRRRPAPPGR